MARTIEKAGAHTKAVTISVWLALVLYPLCLSQAGSQDTSEAQISQIEKALTGHTSPGQSMETRLDDIEVQIYGRVKHGAVNKRLEAIVDLLGIPAQAPATGSSQHDSATTSEQASHKGPPDVPERSTPPAEKPITSARDLLSAPPMSSKSAPTPSKESAGRDQPHTKAKPGSVASAEPSAKLPKSKAQQPANHDQNAFKALTPQMAMPPAAPARAPGPNFGQGLVGANRSIPTAPSRIPLAKPPGNPGQPLTQVASKEEIHQLLQRGVMMHGRGQTQQAEQIFRNVLTLDPRNVDAFYNLGSIAEGRKDFVTALSNYRAALHLSPEDKDLQAAVTQVEEKLRQSVGGSGVQGQSNSKTPDPANHFHADLPSPDILPTSSDQKLFQLSSSQSQIVGGAATADLPVASVGATPTTVPVATVAQSQHGGLSKALSAGAGFILRNSPLHCPLCELLHGL